MRRFTAMQHFIRNLKRIRTERGLTQVQLAEKLGTTQGNISRLLSGVEDVTLSRCEKIAEALGIPIIELIVEPKRHKKAEQQVA